MTSDVLSRFEAALEQLRHQVEQQPLAARFTGSNVLLDGERVPQWVDVGHPLSSREFARLVGATNGSSGRTAVERMPRFDAPPGYYFEFDHPLTDGFTRVGIYHVRTPRAEDGWEGLFLDSLRLGKDAPPGLTPLVVALMAFTAYDIGFGELVTRGSVGGLFAPLGGEGRLHRFDLAPCSASWATLIAALGHLGTPWGAPGATTAVAVEPDFLNTLVLPLEDAPPFGGFGS